MIHITAKAGVVNETLIRNYKRKIDQLRLAKKLRACLTYTKPSKKRRQTRNKAIRTQRFKTAKALS